MSMKTKSAGQNMLKYGILVAILNFSLFLGIYICYTENNWWPLLISFMISWINALFGNNIGLHRYFAHKSFKTTRFKEILLACWSVLLGVRGPIAYSATHRHHHKNSDNKNDIHSPNVDGWVYTSLGFWSFKNYDNLQKIGLTRVPIDLLKDNFLRSLEKNYFTIWIALSLIFYAFGGIKLLIFGLYIPAILFHYSSNIFVVTLGHKKIPGNYRNFDLEDNSWNSNWIQLVTLGEGYQNNHHKDCTTVNHAMKAGEFDPAGWIIKHFFAIKN